MLSSQSNVLILGFGREGRSILSWLISKSFNNVRVYDDNADKLSELSSEQRADTNALNGIDVVIVSPGVPRSHPIITQATELGIRITTGTNLFLESNAHKTIGVTGSKGKSTTSSLIAHILKGQGISVEYGGNIGTPLLALPEADFYVAELSSYQTSYLTHRPHTAVITSLFPDHIDWHGSVEQYYQDKLNLIGDETLNLIINKNDNELVTMVHSITNKELTPSKFFVEHDGDELCIVRLGQKIVYMHEVNLIGEHNLRNACLALNACESVIGEMKLDKVRESLISFAPLPHRLEIVSTHKHVYIDDTLATTPHATSESIKAVRAKYSELPIYLIVGGHDRGLPDYKVLDGAIKEAGNIVLVTVPENGIKIAEQVEGVEVVACTGLEDAVLSTLNFPHGVVLLSPVAPSYGLYNNYEDKSRAFATYIEQASEE